jgi:aminoglycoside/choline kinase family phosphotransferase
MKDLIEWAVSQLQELGYSDIAQPKTIRSRPWSTVLCFNTSKGDAYFKFMAPLFSNEPVLLKFLTSKNILHIPKVIAANPSLRCFLMEEAGDPLRNFLKQNYDMNFVQISLEIYADIQIHCILYVDDLLKINLNDWRLKNFGRLYEDFMQNDALFIADGLSIVEISALKNLRTKIEEAAHQLALIPIPQTLEHTDFHDNNVLIQDGQLTINDFGDACISHPFFSLASFLSSAERHYGLRKNSEAYLMLRDAYLNKWWSYTAYDSLLKAFNLVCLLRPFIFSMNFMRIYACSGIEQTSEFHGYIAEALRELMANFA